MRVKVLKKDYYYNRRQYSPGEEFEMDDRQQGEFNILSTLGLLERVEADKSTQPAVNRVPVMDQQQTVQTRDLLSEENTAEQQPHAVGPMGTESTDALTQRRYYRRTDMRARK